MFEAAFVVVMIGSAAVAVEIGFTLPVVPTAVVTALVGRVVVKDVFAWSVVSFAVVDAQRPQVLSQVPAPVHDGQNCTSQARGC